MKFCFLILSIIPILIYSQKEYPRQEILEYDGQDIYEEYIDDQDNILTNILQDIDISNANIFEKKVVAPMTNIQLNHPMSIKIDSLYSNYYSPDFESKKIPKLLTSEGMLQNLNGTIWQLKFYNVRNTVLYKKIRIYIKDSKIKISIIKMNGQEEKEQKYLLTPIKMLRSNEGIFAYSDKKDNIYFIYMRLVLQHLLAIEMTSDYQDAEKSASKSLTDLGIFILQ